MIIIKTVKEAQEFSRRQRRSGRKVAFVPTMGFLHEGHMSLVDRARQLADCVVVSIFVNPTQFGPNEDLSAYPRDFDRDRGLCEARGADAIFYPDTSEMYFPDASTFVVEESLTGTLCGKSRPVHFRGVATVVAKLFNAAQPDFAVFGQKDAQQVLVIKKMARDLCFPVEIVVCPIVREPDGLALSSRNKYLSPSDRRDALAISRSLRAAAAAIEAGERDAAKVRAGIVAELEAAGGGVDYVEAVDARDLKPLETLSRPLLVAVAAKFGPARLIDNLLME